MLFSYEYFEQAATCFIHFSFHIFPQMWRIPTVAIDLLQISLYSANK